MPQQVTDAAAPSAAQPAPVFQVLSESTIRRKDGSSITFRQVVPPITALQSQSVGAATTLPEQPATAVAPAAVQEADQSQGPVKETAMLSISASVHANGLTVLRWTCGTSQRLYAVSNADFRYMEGIANLKTEQSEYFIILSAGEDDQEMSAAEVQAAQALPQNDSAAFALVAGVAPSGAADESALNAIEVLLDYFDSNKAELVALKAQRDAARIAREQAAQNAPPPLPRQSVVNFWRMQPEQRAAIVKKTQPEKGVEQ